MAEQQAEQSKQPKQSKAKGKQRGDFDYEQAAEQGYIGAVAEDPPNEAYQVDADHAGTAQAERKALRERRQQEADDSREQA